MVLPLALGILAVLSLSTVAVIEFSTHNSGNASRSSADQTAYALAEAGIANAFSVLNQAVDPKTSTLLDSNTSLAGIQPFTVAIEGGTVEYSGTYNSATYTWSISSKGIVRNPTGVSASPVTRRLTRAATVVGLNSGATVGAWSRMYHDSTTTCMTIEDVTIPTPIASRGDVCLKGSGKITGDQTTVEVGDDVFMTRTTSTAVRPAGTGAGTTWTTPTNVGLQQQRARHLQRSGEPPEHEPRCDGLRLRDSHDREHHRGRGDDRAQREPLECAQGRRRVPAEGRGPGGYRPRLGHLLAHY